MAGEPIITVVGNLTGDPELRYTPSGHPVAAFTVASTPRTLNRQTRQWQNGSDPVHPLLHMARIRRERRRDPDQGDAGGRHRPSGRPLLRAQRPAAHEPGDPSRGDRPLPALRPRPRQPGRRRGKHPPGPVGSSLTPEQATTQVKNASGLERA